MSRIVLGLAFLAAALFLTSVSYASPKSTFVGKIYCYQQTRPWGQSITVNVGTIYNGDAVRVVISQPMTSRQPVVMMHDMYPKAEHKAGIYQDLSFRLTISPTKKPHSDYEYPATLEFLQAAGVRETVVLACTYL